MADTPHSEIALRRRRDKQDFAAGFPGLLQPAEARGKTVAQVTETGSGHLLLFTDGTFLLAQLPDLKPEALLAELQAARPVLEPAQPEAYTELDRLVAAEAEAMRLARMEKVLGAVENNLPQIPELREELRRLLDG